jgi:hypothetical membrane protein
MSLNFPRLFCYIGLCLIASGFSYSAVCYRGRQGEKYSVLNHFISELGEVGVSTTAWAFNLSLIVGGILISPFVIGLGIKLGGIFGWLGIIAGLTTTLGVAAVGIFPMNKLDLHIRAAQTYFRAGLVMVLLFGLAILFQPDGHKVIPPMANLISLLAFIAYASFLLLVKPGRQEGENRKADTLNPLDVPVRPRVWLFPLLEWGVFFATLVWLLGIAFFL